MKRLPHFAPDGKTLCPMDRSYFYMVFPGNEQDAIRAATVIEDEKNAIQQSLQDGFGEIGKFVLKKLDERHIRGMACGQVFYQIVLNTVNHSKPDFRKSVFSVAEALFSGRTPQGEPIRISGDNLRKYFPMFAGAAHLWASFAFLDPHEQEQAFVENAVFHKLMIGAEFLRLTAIEIRLPSLVPAMRDWDPWCPHPVYGEILINGEADVEFPGDSDRLIAKMEEYRNKPYENSP